jgi:hypothetical protein
MKLEFQSQSTLKRPRVCAPDILNFSEKGATNSTLGTFISALNFMRFEDFTDEKAKISVIWDEMHCYQISEKHATSFFLADSCTLQMKAAGSYETRYASTKSQGVTSQQTIIFITLYVVTSNGCVAKKGSNIYWCTLTSLFPKNVRMLLHLLYYPQGIKYYMHAKLTLNRETQIRIYNKKFWEELIAYFSLLRHGRHRKRSFQKFFAAAGTSLASCYLAAIRGYTDRPTDSHWWDTDRIKNYASNNYSIVACIRCSVKMFT